jgi:PIN domain nuclease of toxin-antitoxin system
MKKYNNYILDTHILIWYSTGSPRITRELQDLIANADNIYISSCTWHEIAILASMQKIQSSLKLYEEVLLYLDAKVLGFDHSSAGIYTGLTTAHKDPFDKAIVATAIAFDLTLVTADKTILSGKYNNLKCLKVF